MSKHSIDVHGSDVDASRYTGPDATSEDTELSVELDTLVERGHAVERTGLHHRKPEKTEHGLRIPVPISPRASITSGSEVLLEDSHEDDEWYRGSRKGSTLSQGGMSTSHTSLDVRSSRKLNSAIKDARAALAETLQPSLSTISENFRHKLILNFHLIDILQQPSTQIEVPQYDFDDVGDKAKREAMIRKDPHSLVKMPPMQAVVALGPKIDPLYTRIQHKVSKWPASSYWAKWVVKSNLFQTCILILILLNSVVLGIQAEVGDIQTAAVEPLKLALDIFDYCSLFVFTLEIILKWMEDFIGFWPSAWNVFDFAVTFASIVPEVINIATGTFGKRVLDRNSNTYNIQVVASNLRIFRVLRALKVVTRFGKVKIIILAITKAVGSMMSILVLTFSFAYIYSIVGVVYFREGYAANSETLHFPDSFNGISNALITLFQLLSLDKWRWVLEDSQTSANSFVAAMYIFSWVIFGSFIVKNLFIGILVDNFQSIRNELKDLQSKDTIQKENIANLNQFVQDIEQIGKEKDQKDKEREAIKERVKEKYGSIIESESAKSEEAQTKSMEDIQSLQSLVLQHKSNESEDWINKVEKILGLLEKQKVHHIWPKDTVFQYFLTMESLLENLEERKELLNLACDVILELHDDP